MAAIVEAVGLCEVWFLGNGNGSMYVLVFGSFLVG